MGLKVAVIGGSGFIGKPLVRCLVKRRHQVTVLDIRDNGDDGASGATFHPLNITDYESTIRALEDVEVVFDLAGTVLNVARKRPHLAVSLDVMGAANILEACVENKVSKIVYASSFYAYDGLTAVRSVSERNHTDIFSAEMFGVVKLVGERLVGEYAKTRDLKYVILRYGPVYGPDERCTSVIYDFIKSGLSGHALVVWGKGDRRNQYTYVEDVAEATASSITEEDEIFNIISPEQVTMKGIVEMMSRDYGFDVKYDYDKPEAQSLPYISCEKARKKLDWHPLTLREGVGVTTDNLRSHYQPIIKSI